MHPEHADRERDEVHHVAQAVGVELIVQRPAQRPAGGVEPVERVRPVGSAVAPAARLRSERGLERLAAHPEGDAGAGDRPVDGPVHSIAWTCEWDSDGSASAGAGACARVTAKQVASTPSGYRASDPSPTLRPCPAEPRDWSSSPTPSASRRRSCAPRRTTPSSTAPVSPTGPACSSGSAARRSSVAGSARRSPPGSCSGPPRAELGPGPFGAFVEEPAFARAAQELVRRPEGGRAQARGVRGRGRAAPSGAGAPGALPRPALHGLREEAEEA